MCDIPEDLDVLVELGHHDVLDGADVVVHLLDGHVVGRAGVADKVVPEGQGKYAKVVTNQKLP